MRAQNPERRPSYQTLSHIEHDDRTVDSGRRVSLATAARGKGSDGEGRNSPCCGCDLGIEINPIQRPAMNLKCDSSLNVRREHRGARNHQAYEQLLFHRRRSRKLESLPCRRSARRTFTARKVGRGDSPRGSASLQGQNFYR